MRQFQSMSSRCWLYLLARALQQPAAERMVQLQCKTRRKNSGIVMLDWILVLLWVWCYGC